MTEDDRQSEADLLARIDSIEDAIEGGDAATAEVVFRDTVVDYPEGFDPVDALRSAKAEDWRGRSLPDPEDWPDDWREREGWPDPLDFPEPEEVEQTTETIEVRFHGEPPDSTRWRG